ncbi:MAG: hypothetical protein HPY44_11700 [Armatimonadetes bacterium]|nr:hypothetical protein [Armatimonadota bacterium]
MTLSEEQALCILLLVTLAALLPAWCQAASVPSDDVLLYCEVEKFGLVRDLSPIEIPGASGGQAMQMTRSTSGVWAVMGFEPGEYTLLLRVWAPAGDQDGFFVDIRDKRDRRVPPTQRRWHTMAYNITVDAPEQVLLAAVAQELGFVVDQVAVVRGTFQTDQVRMEDLPGKPGEGIAPDPDALPRMETSARLASLPVPGTPPAQDVVFAEDFEGRFTGAKGVTALVDGPTGKALNLGVPDGRFVVSLGALDLGPTGTVEFRVKPREAQQLWWDQGWHYLLHLEPASPDGSGVSLGLYRRPDVQLRLEAKSADEKETEGANVSTSGLDNTAWHHILVSWDLTGERQRLWLLVDGDGKQVEFRRKLAPGAFRQLEIGNSPESSGLPYLFLDGAIDEVRVSKESVAGKLAAQ